MNDVDSTRVQSTKEEHPMLLRGPLTPDPQMFDAADCAPHSTQETWLRCLGRIASAPVARVRTALGNSLRRPVFWQAWWSDWQWWDWPSWFC